MDNKSTYQLIVAQPVLPGQTGANVSAKSPVQACFHSWDELPLSFGVETLAFVMGCKIGKARAICSKGELCCYKEGKRYIIFKQDLIDWLEQRRKNMKRAKSA